MKRFLLIPSCALLALSALTSCQKEDKTVTELAQELTGELQQISDYKTAEALAPRVEVLNKRLQDAGVRVFALQATSLQRGADDSEGSEGASYAEALGRLAAEVARVQVSAPTGAEGEIDRDKLVLAVGAANGAGDSSPASQRKAAGSKYYKTPTDAAETPGAFAEFYGSARLKEALDYTADPAAVSMFQMDDDVPQVPAAGAVAEEEDDAAAADEDATADTATDTATDTAEDTPATDTDSSTSSDDAIPSLDIDDDSSSSDDDDSSSDDLDIDLGL